MAAFTRSALALAALSVTLAGCNPGPSDSAFPESTNRDSGATTGSAYEPERDRGSILGSAGNILGGGDDDAPAGGTGIGVNAYLWRASLDTLSFMPLGSADPFGGVILTDWYAPPEASNERFKVNLYILGRQLRADGLRVSVFRQERGPQGQWRDVEVNGQTATELENAILARAREMRIASVQ